MKNLKYALTFIGLLILTCITSQAKVKVAPYYSLDLIEGVSIPNKGGSMFALNLVNDLGLMVQPGEKHSLVGFYELKYSGPGLKRQEGEKFSDRAMDHILLLRHQYKLNDLYTFKTQLDYMTEYKRTGTNEVWGKGLYDFNRTGFAIITSRKFTKKLSADVSFGYHFLQFPNYTDLLAEFQAGGEDIESSTGKQNHALYQIGAKAKYGASNVSVDYTLMNYKKQKVTVENKQADGTYYSSTLQKDSILSFSAGHHQKIFNVIHIIPSASLKLKNSNQNYQHFATATSSVPVQYVGDFYDYSEINLSIPCSFMLGSKWETFFNVEYDWKTYSNRPPRDNDNNFISGKQKNDLFIWSTGFTFKPNEVTRTTLFYTFQSQSSNMKFEKYLPYNYDGHYIGINFNYTY